MKVCFHHDYFDVDVSSGTIHSMYQWFDLLHAFGVFECAIINNTDDDIPTINSDMTVTEYSRLDDFLSLHGNVVFVEQGGSPYRDYDFGDTEWLVFGGTAGLPRADVGIETLGNRALYPRSAAAIILAVI